MMPLLTSEITSFTLDNMGRYLCNTSQEALASAGLEIAGNRRDFDVIVIGGGSFGSVIAAHLFNIDRTHRRRILVLEQGPFVLPEHVQNLPFLGGDPTPRVPWTFPQGSAYGFAGLIYAIGGRSLTWGGWSPEPLHDGKNDEMRNWPPSVIADLQARYFAEAGDQLGVTSTNDFIHGALHTALRQRLFDGLSAASKPGKPLANKLILDELPNHPAVRDYEKKNNGNPPPDEQLREWLGLEPQDNVPQNQLLPQLKLEAPLAVQTSTEPGLFPFNKFSAIPLLIQAARTAANEADGVGTKVDSRKRLMVVPKCHVLELITETQSDNWMRVTGVRFIDEAGTEQKVFLAPPKSDRTQSAVVIALGTIESTRLAETTFQASLAGRARDRMGKNLMAHLRSNLTIRLQKAVLGGQLPQALQSSALFAKGKARIQGTNRYFHLQITASGLSNLGTESEAELFKKIPDLDNLNRMLQANDSSIVVTLRGIGEMVPGNPESIVELSNSSSDTEYGRPKAFVQIGNADKPTAQSSAETNNDASLWEAMDAFTDQVALILANGQPFEILTNNGTLSITVPNNATANDLAQLHPHTKRHDLLGSTHHEAGTLRMSLLPADGVANEFGRIHDTANCYVVGPALLPTGGSPNPMLTGVALARRTADLLNKSVLPKPEAFDLTAQEKAENQAAAPGAPQWKVLFDGTTDTFKNWRLVGPVGGGMLHINGEMVSYGDGGLRLFYYATQAFGDFILRLQFRIFDAANHNSGVFIRFPRPTLDLNNVLDARSQQEPSFDRGNFAWKPVIAGFEVQIDDNARGDTGKDFYGIKPEPDGLFKNRTGAIYKIQAGDRIWHLNMNEPQVQNYTPGPALMPGIWFEYEIVAQGQDYTVFLTNMQTGMGQQTTTFHNTDGERGRAPGFIGVQVYPGSTVAWRNIRIKTA